MATFKYTAFDENEKNLQGFIRNPLVSFNCDPNIVTKRSEKGHFGLKTTEIAVLRPRRGRGSILSLFFGRKWQSF